MPATTKSAHAAGRPREASCEPDSTLPSLLGGHLSRACPYGPPMKTQRPVAPRNATIDRDEVRREGRAIQHRSGLAGAAVGVIFAIALAACTPAGSSPLPIGSPGLPSVDASALASAAAGAASAAAGAAMTALDQVDAAITANTSSTGLTADDAASLTTLTAGVRTALQTGDTTAAKAAVDNLKTKVDSLAAKLNSATGQQLTAAVTALKAALP
jgi:hypothetical protein